MDAENEQQVIQDGQKKPQIMKTVFHQINLDNLMYGKREHKQRVQLPIIPSTYRPNGIKKIPRLQGDPPRKPGRKKKVIVGNDVILEPVKEAQQSNETKQSPSKALQGADQFHFIPSLQTVKVKSFVEKKRSVLKNDHPSESCSSFEPSKNKYKRTYQNKKKKGLCDEELEEIIPKERTILARLNKIFKKSYESKQILTENENLEIKELFKNYYERIFQNIQLTEEELQSLNKIVEPSLPNGSSEQIQQHKIVKRVLTEDGLEIDTQRNLKLLDIELQKYTQTIVEQQTFINCDLRYFNLDFLTEKVGEFDVVLMDPPWRIKGGQQNDSQFMFTNSKFSLEYNTMSNQEIMDIKVEKLSKKGFLFLWILNTQLNIAYEMANKWGYEIVDQIIWVKLNSAGNNIYLSTGYYFMHSFEICLVGYKCPQGEHVEYHSKISNNVLFSGVRSKSQKPNQLYEIIELMMPGAKKIELFARNNNLRHGWFSLGNQLGETYKKWQVEINCNLCNLPLLPGNKRHKSRRETNYDICDVCFIRKEQKSKEEDNQDKFDPLDFFDLMNKADEEVLHQYHSCNNCQQEPIWGVRFDCIDCENYDLCENCFDIYLGEKKIHNPEHNFRAIEIPTFAEGIPCHDAKCNGCFQKPILGVQFVCKSCTNFNLCQNCFFARTPQEFASSRHKADHKLEPIYEVQLQTNRQFKCQGCELDITNGEAVYKCENCFGFYFCDKCFVTRKDDWKSYLATSHKKYHSFIKLQ